MPIDFSPAGLTPYLSAHEGRQAFYDSLVPGQEGGAPAPPTEPSPHEPGPHDTHAGIAPYLALLGGQAGDVGSTLYNLHRGYHELNPVLGGREDNIPRIVATKAATTAGMMLLMRLLAAHGHPGLAKLMGYTGGAMGAIPTAQNLSLPDREGQ